MTANSIGKEIEKLREEIRRHEELYYAQARPEISDQAFDGLMAKLMEMEREHPELVTGDSPSQRVGGKPIEGFESVRHAVRMMSIDNTYDEGEVREFDARVRKLLGTGEFEYTCEPKIDGVSLSLRYEEGVLKTAATRGDGRTGDDVTVNAKTIRNIPLRLGKTQNSKRKTQNLFGGAEAEGKRVVEVRGEVFISRAQFAKINEQQEEKGEEAYANPRNTASGTLKQLDPKVVAGRKLEFLPHGSGELVGVEVKDYAGWQKLLREMGFRVNELVERCEGVEEVLAYIHRFAETRAGLPYDTDGVVVKVNDFEQREVLGVTSKAPRWCIAYKYQPERAETEVVRVVFQVGKTGTITPVAEFEPVVFISGTNVYRASLHNFDEIERKGIHLHDRVLVEKAGEVIPYVVGVVEGKRTGKEKVIARPTSCPSCGTRDLENDGGFVRCLNPDCPAQLEQRIRFWAGRNQMSIDELGEKLIEKLIAKGYVKSIPDLYRLTHEQLVETLKKEAAKGDSNPTKAAQNVLEGIAASKGRGLARLIAGLGILDIGVRTAQIVVEHFPTVEKLMGASLGEILAVPDMGGGVLEDFAGLKERYPAAEGVTLEQVFGFGEIGKKVMAELEGAEPVSGKKRAGELMEGIRSRGVAARSLYGFLHSGSGERTLRELSELGLKMEETQEERSGPQPLLGMTVVVTGTLVKFTRGEIKKRIEELGGKTTESVSKNTSFVVAGEEAGSKLEKAKKVGVEVLDEEGFLKRIGGTT